MGKAFSGLVLIAMLALIAVGGYFYRYATSPLSDDGKTIAYVVQPGPFARIARDLKEEGIISSSKMFSWYARITGQADDVKVGEYKISANESPQEILATLTSGKSMTYPVTFQEGLNIYEVAEVLEKRGFVKKQDFIDLCFSKAFIQELLGEKEESLEGYLFPNTYLFTRFTGIKNIIREMVKQFFENYEIVASSTNKVVLNRRQTITLASIIEKETGVTEERGLVSSVFHNRMKKGMMLQTDPTVIYGMWRETGAMPANIKKSDLLKPTEFNTYTFRGLPPGPIANPGRAAMAAALNPEESEYLFFVSQNNGTHIFSETYEKHNSAVRRFQQDAKARKGKSWRDYSKAQSKQ